MNLYEQVLVEAQARREQAAEAKAIAFIKRIRRFPAGAAALVAIPKQEVKA